MTKHTFIFVWLALAGLIFYLADGIQNPNKIKKLGESKMCIRDSAGISRSPKLSNFCEILSKALSTYSVGTGRLCKAREKDNRNFSRLNSSRVPLVFTTCGCLLYTS